MLFALRKAGFKRNDLCFRNWLQYLLNSEYLNNALTFSYSEFGMKYHSLGFPPQCRLKLMRFPPSWWNAKFEFLIPKYINGFVTPGMLTFLRLFSATRSNWKVDFEKSRNTSGSSLASQYFCKKGPEYRFSKNSSLVIFPSNIDS